jgi:hypothetical protein
MCRGVRSSRGARFTNYLRKLKMAKIPIAPRGFKPKKTALSRQSKASVSAAIKVSHRISIR